MTNNDIAKTVMQRVRTIYMLRLVSVPAAAGLVFLLALWGVGREVWVAKVFENMPTLSDVPGVLSFYAGAFAGTDLFVQALLLLAAGALALGAKALADTLQQMPRFA